MERNAVYIRGSAAAAESLRERPAGYQERANNTKVQGLEEAKGGVKQCG